MSLKIKLTKLLKSDTSRDSIFGIAGQGVAAVSGFIFFAWAANVVSLEEFGYFSLALATAAIIKDVIDPALNATLVKFIAKGKESARYITRYVLQIKFLYFALILGVGFLFPSFLSRVIFKQEWGFLVIMTVATSAALSGGALISGFLQGHRLFMKDALFVALQPIIRLIFFATAVYFGYLGVIELLVVNVLAYLTVIGMFASVITIDFVSGEVSPLTKSAANKFIAPITLSTITGTLIDRIGLFITNYFLGPAQVGLLSAVLRLFIPAQQIAGVLNSVFGTRFAGFTSQKQSNTYLKKSLLVITPIAMGALLAVPLAPFILRIFGEEYVEGAILLRIISFGFIAFLFQVPFIAKMVYYKNRTDILVWISVIQLVLTTVLQWFLIQAFGLLGAALAITLTMVSISILYMLTATTAKRKKV